MTAFGSLAENIVDSLHKGDKVVVDGYFDSARTYQVEVNGATETRIALDIIAQEVAPSLRFATTTILRNVRNDSTTASGISTAYDDVEEPF